MDHEHIHKHTGAAGSSRDCEVKPFSEVRDLVAQLEGQTDRINTILQNLRSRLDPVLTSPIPTAECKPGPGLAAVGPSTRLGQELANILHANANTCDELNDLISRIHV